jgi:hypothetical protein
MKQVQSTMRFTFFTKLTSSHTPMTLSIGERFRILSSKKVEKSLQTVQKGQKTAQKPIQKPVQKVQKPIQKPAKNIETTKARNSPRLTKKKLSLDDRLGKTVHERLGKTVFERLGKPLPKGTIVIGNSGLILGPKKVAPVKKKRTIKM